MIQATRLLCPCRGQPRVGPGLSMTAVCWSREATTSLPCWDSLRHSPQPSCDKCLEHGCALHLLPAQLHREDRDRAPGGPARPPRCPSSGFSAGGRTRGHKETGNSLSVMQSVSPVWAPVRARPSPGPLSPVINRTGPGAPPSALVNSRMHTAWQEGQRAGLVTPTPPSVPCPQGHTRGGLSLGRDPG